MSGQFAGKRPPLSTAPPPPPSTLSNPATTTLASWHPRPAKCLTYASEPVFPLVIVSVYLLEYAHIATRTLLMKKHARGSARPTYNPYPDSRTTSAAVFSKTGSELLSRGSCIYLAFIR